MFNLDEVIEGLEAGRAYERVYEDGNGSERVSPAGEGLFLHSVSSHTPQGGVAGPITSCRSRISGMAPRPLGAEERLGPRAALSGSSASYPARAFARAGILFYMNRVRWNYRQTTKNLIRS